MNEIKCFIYHIWGTRDTKSSETGDKEVEAGVRRKNGEGQNYKKKGIDNGAEHERSNLSRIVGWTMLALASTISVKWKADRNGSDEWMNGKKVNLDSVDWLSYKKKRGIKWSLKVEM